MSERTKQIIIIAIIAAILGNVWFFAGTHIGRATWNIWFGTVQRVDDATNYRTKKEVEDTCRSMIASYESDRLTYEQYKGSESSEQRSWAEQAKMRANKTASTYNNFILKNSYVWEANVPKDIVDELPYLD